MISGDIRIFTVYTYIFFFGLLSNSNSMASKIVNLRPGETLIIPSGWWQCSLALEPFTTMCRRFWDRSNRLGICDELARLSELRDASKEQRMRLASQMPLLREQIQEDDLSSGAD